MSWKPIHRVIHLPGGLRLINRIGSEVYFDSLDSREELVLNLRQFDDLYLAAARLGLLPVGVEMIVSKEEQDGHASASFRSLDVMNHPPWPCGYQGDQWQFLAHAAESANDQTLHDIASRVSHELRGCDELIRELSKTYRLQLRSAVRNGKPPGARFADSFTNKVHQAFEAYLARAGVLRDHLGEFYAWVSNGPKVTPAIVEITTIAGVLKDLKKRPRTDAFAAAILSATEEGGWLHTLSAYRNLVIHGSRSLSDFPLPKPVDRADNKPSPASSDGP